MPQVIEQSLHMLSQAVIPLMLVAVGMALRWQRNWLTRVPCLLPMLLAQLLFMPTLAWWLTTHSGMETNTLIPVVIEAGMPTMVLGLVVCDRFRLDSSIYAEAVTLSTLVSFVSLPLWLGILNQHLHTG